MKAPRRHPAWTVVRHLWPWALVALIGLIGYTYVKQYLDDQRGAEPIVWRSKRAGWLALGGLLVGFAVFHLQRRRAASMGFTRVGLVGARGPLVWLVDLPGVLRVLGIACLAAALARPETYRTVVYHEDSVDIMIVLDMSKSMEETDLPRDRMDAAQRVIRRFVRRTAHDRVGLVIFGQQAMLHTPLTSDMVMLEQIVADLAIGDVPELGTAIGDGLAMAVAVLRRSSGQCEPPPKANTCPEEFACGPRGYCEPIKKKTHKVVILLSDGDNNFVARFNPEDAARTAAANDIQVHTVLVGNENAMSTDVFRGRSVNPATLRSIAKITGGEFFHASDYEAFERGFAAVRAELDTVKRERREHVPDKQLFVPLAMIGALLIALEMLLSHTWLRRMP
ncbi:MAG: VWA domain-containing protein [Deltaproteobacteria bacterium]|nr:VWA domain-containing protein [Deltaproteobacteria bacterium]